MYKVNLALKPTITDIPKNPTTPNPRYLIYMYKEDLALNNLQWMILP